MLLSMGLTEFDIFCKNSSMWHEFHSYELEVSDGNFEIFYTSPPSLKWYAMKNSPDVVKYFLDGHKDHLVYLHPAPYRYVVHEKYTQEPMPVKIVNLMEDVKFNVFYHCMKECWRESDVDFMFGYCLG